MKAKHLLYVPKVNFRTIFLYQDNIGSISKKKNLNTLPKLMKSLHFPIGDVNLVWIHLITQLYVN